MRDESIRVSKQRRIQNVLQGCALRWKIKAFGGVKIIKF